MYHERHFASGHDAIVTLLKHYKRPDADGSVGSGYSSGGKS